MQKILEKLKNISTNASQVCSSIISELNMDKTSYPLIEAKCSENVLSNINTEVNQSGNTQSFKNIKVFVISKQGSPLMPCSPAKAKHLLKEKKAKVVRRMPFTIQLNFECENIVQPIILGIDTGFGNIGFSATTEKDELVCGTLVLDGKTKERLDERRMYRRGKRARHHWYRQARFLNRKKKAGWLPPSIKRRYDTHLNLIDKLKKMLPISKVIVEVAKFDIQKIENPEIEGKEYQQGKLYYLDKISYLRNIQNNKCLFCKKEFEVNQSKATHHIFQRGDNRRTDKIDGLILLHKKCHVDLHEKHREKDFQNIKFKSYKQSIFMSIINKKFFNDIEDLRITFGNVTSLKREEYNIEKSHFNDAFVISGGTIQKRVSPFEIIQKRINNRALQLNRNGFKPSIRKQRYKIQPKDLVFIYNKWVMTSGMHCKGKRVMVGGKSIAIKNIEKYFNNKSLIWGLKIYLKD